MGPYAGVDYNLTLCPLESRLQHNYHGNPMPESTLPSLRQSRPYPPYAKVDFIPQSDSLYLASGSKRWKSPFDRFLY
jgi:hypothetical protein